MISRRSLLSSSSLITLGFFVSTNPARAQVAQLALERLRAELPSVFAPDARFYPDPAYADRFLNEELSARKVYFSLLADTSVDDIRNSLDPAAEELGIQTHEDVQSFVQARNYIQAIKTQQEIAGTEGESLFEVVLDIVIETLGLDFMREALSRMVIDDKVFSGIIEAITDKLEIRDHNGAAR